MGGVLLREAGLTEGETTPHSVLQRAGIIVFECSFAEAFISVTEFDKSDSGQISGSHSSGYEDDCLSGCC
jgi:hypothetical protein